MYHANPHVADIPSPKMMRASAEAREALHQRDENLPSATSPSSASSPSARSPYTSHMAAADAGARRRGAAEWMESITGVAVPYASEQAFRSALKDGVLLCRIANSIWPGIVSKVMDAPGPEGGPSGLMRQRTENITAFIRALEGLIPADCTFSVTDLDSDHASEDRPVVANCMLFLKTLTESGAIPRPMPLRSPRAGQLSSGAGQQSQQQAAHSLPGHAALYQQHQQQQQQVQQQQQQARYSPTTQQAQQLALLQARMTPRSSYSRPATAPTINPLDPIQSPYANEPPFAGATAALQRFANASSSSSTNPFGGNSGSGNGADSIKAAQSKSVQAAAGVTRLMQQCTAMLRERMYVDGPGAPQQQQQHRPPPPPRYAAPAPDSSALEAMGPVLENVLSSLTMEYEKRLLTKDHELNHAREANAVLQKQVLSLQGDLARMQVEVDVRGAEAARAAAAAAGKDASRLREELAAAQASLREREAALESLNSAVDSSARAKAAREGALRDQLEAAAQKLAGLEGVEERYARAIEENRRLYNTVQDLRGNIRVFCRIRPPGATGDASPSCIDAGLDGDLAVYDITRHGERKTFKVDRVYEPEATQVTIYDDTQPLIRSVLDGYNVCIFAYGQTGSGKTHTMSGTHTRNPEGRGINYRALDDLFAIRDNRQGEVTYTLRVQMLEIYNEGLRDLLLDTPANGGKLDILSTQASGCNVPGATQIEVTDALDVTALMARGAANRHTSETKMNDRSSRSHQILTVIVDGVDCTTGAKSHGCLHLIDLAGSERVSKSEASGDRLVEAQHINRSLSALGDVMSALASKSQHIPFRNSKLTQLLQDSLSGQAKVMMFMHISPEASMHGESVSTLMFAKRVAEITLGQAKRNVESCKVFEAHEQVAAQRALTAQREQQMRELHAALASERSELSVVTSERDALAREAHELRSQLEATKKAAMLASMQHPTPRSALPSPANGHHHHSHLPGPSPRVSNASSGFGHGARDAGSSGAAAGSRVPRLPLEKSGLLAPDRSPMRDQDIDGIDDEPTQTTPMQQRSLSPPLDALDTPRSHRGTAPRRGSASSKQHIERLVSARRSSLLLTPAALEKAAATLAKEAGGGPASARTSYASLGQQRSQTNVGMPSTARTAAAAAAAISKQRAPGATGNSTSRRTSDSGNSTNSRTSEAGSSTGRQRTAVGALRSASTNRNGSPGIGGVNAAQHSARVGAGACARSGSTSRWK